MSLTKVNKSIAGYVHEEIQAKLKELKDFLDDKMDDADAVLELIDEFSEENTLKKVQSKVKTKVPKADKPKRTRKKTFYNVWLGERLKSFALEQ